MNLQIFFIDAVLLALVMLGMDQWHQPVVAFELRHMAFSNTTKNRLMIPLRLDDAVLTCHHATRAGSDRNTATSSPRGIVLNSAVGGLTFAGGLMGFITKGSKASLIAGSVFGGFLMFSALLISNASSSKSTAGNIVGFSVSGMLGFVMGKKFLVSKKFIPAGLLAFLSATGFVYNLIETKIVYSSKSTDAKKDASSSSTEVEEDATSKE